MRMEQGTPRMTILTRYLQAKLLDSGNWEGGSDKHFSIFLSKLTKPMKGFTFTDTRVGIHRPTKECCDARASKPLHGAMMKHMDWFFIVPITERILPGESSLCSVNSLTLQNSAFETPPPPPPPNHCRNTKHASIPLDTENINAYFQDTDLQGCFAVET